MDPNVNVSISDSLKDKVSVVVATLVGMESLFTAFDITKQVRIENPGMSVPHQDVRNMVKLEMGNNDDYDKTMTKLSIGPVSIVYHPNHIPATEHPLAVKPVVDDTDDTDDIDDTDDSTNDNLDSDLDADSDLTLEKRLNVPKKCLSSIGVSPGQRLTHRTENGVMSITKTYPAKAGTLVVNSDGRLRIGSRTLTAAFGTLGDKYDVRVSSDKTAIVVRPN